MTLYSGVGTTKRFVMERSWEIKGFIAVVQLLGIRSFTEKAFRETAEATISRGSDTLSRMESEISERSREPDALQLWRSRRCSDRARLGRSNVG